MTGACLLVGATALTLASGGFDLTWRHSVERTEWRESWRVADGVLRLTEAAGPVMSEIRQIADTTRKELLDGLATDDLNAARRVLAMIAERLERTE